MVDNPNNLNSEFEQQIVNPLIDESKCFKEKLSKNENRLEDLDKSIQSKHDDYVAKLNTYKNDVVTKINGFFDSGKKIFSDSVDSFGNYLLINVSIGSLILIIIGSTFGISVWETDGLVGNNSYLLGDNLFLNNVIFNILIPISLYIFFIFLVLFSKQKFKREKSKNFDDLKDNTGIKDLEPGTYSIEVEKKEKNDVFGECISSFKDATEVFLDTIPIYQSINAREKFKEKWNLECDKLKMVTTFFGLSNLKSALESIGKLPNLNLKDSDEIIIKDSIISLVCEKTSFDETLMNLFVSYYEENNETVDIWEDIKSNDKQLLQLAEILFKLKKLNFEKGILTVTTLQKILAKTQTFNLTLITNNVSLYIRIHKFLTNYREKLSKEIVILKHQLNDEEIVDNINFECTFEDNVITIFYEEIYQSLDVDFKNAYVDALMAIVLNQDINFRAQVCKKVSENDDSIKVLMAYHDLRKQKGEENEQFKLCEIFVKAKSLSEITEEIENYHDSRKKFEYFKSGLSRGEWYESSQIITQKMIEDLSIKIDTEKKYNTLKNIYTKVFKKVNINTLDKAVDAGLFSVYLILTSKPKPGNFIDRLDDLSIRNVVPDPSGNYLKKDSKTIEKVQADYHISLYSSYNDLKVPKYDFVKYSASTRIGILHKSISFSTFVDSINKDIEKLMPEISEDTDKKWKNIGFIVLRISPSKYSFGIMDKEIENRRNIELANLDIAEKIATLSSDYLSEEQKTAISTFDNTINLMEIINQQTIYEFISEDIQETLSKNEVLFLKKESLRISVSQCLKKNEINSFKHLSILLNHSSETDIKQLKESLSSAFAEEYSKYYPSPLRENKRNLFVSQFLELLKLLHEIWNL